ncbi:arylsulfatase B-like [Physella acuta]|uniref:arylsulfatase B-like n=1 Tax=Physella acuta TaxID=109671 RepID=UPI0027DD2378|nr:arylsulfatase B-like [Physella acuta]XP_059143574.1 arylsulfatase B-like [Physella acuta]
MRRWSHVLLCLLVTILGMASSCRSQPAHPHIVMIVADDLGWNDIGFNNPNIISPNLDALAREGIILNQSYVQPLCSPSRAALMTGYYPFRLGLQHLVITQEQAVCVPDNKTLLPQVLKKQGYATHIIGKWHLGFCKWECTPTFRGFDSFFGYYNAMEDHYTKMYGQGYDFRDNQEVYKAANGTYSSYLYTERIKQVINSHDPQTPLFLYLPFQNVHEPLEVPENFSNLYPNIKDVNRRTFSGMVTALDAAVGQVVKALKDRGLYDDTLIVFTADNGGWVPYGGNNLPLRGGKFTVFEGGTRAVAFVHGPMFYKTGIRYDGMFHMVDWFPTLAEVSGSTYTDPDADGVSQWKSLLSLSLPSARQEVVYNLDFSIDPFQGRAAIRVGDYKLVAGFPGLFPDWYQPGQVARPILERWNDVTADGTINWHLVNETLFKVALNDPPIYYYLFNLKDDPAERTNIYDDHPDIVQQLEDRLNYHKQHYIPPNFPPGSPAANPAHYGGAWTPGWC